MFKKCISMLAAAILCMLSACALAQGDAAVTLGEGNKTVIVVAAASQDDMVAFEVKTDADTLPDALLEVELIEVEKASWGYNVVSVAGARADYEKDGSYWLILEQDEATGEFVRMETGIDSVKLPEFFTMGFLLMK